MEFGYRLIRDRDHIPLFVARRLVGYGLFTLARYSIGLEAMVCLVQTAQFGH